MFNRLHYSAALRLINSLKPIQREQLISNEVKKCQHIVEEITKQKLNLDTNRNHTKDVHEENLENKIKTLKEKLALFEEDSITAKTKEERFRAEISELHLNCEALKRNLLERNAQKADLQRKLEENILHHQSEIQSQTAEISIKSEKHEVFGDLIYDFGFKRVYATQPDTLCDRKLVPIWKKQRLYNEDRAKEIAKSKRKDIRFGYPGVITVFEQHDGKAVGVIDGQHRLGSLAALLETGHWQSSNPILTEVYQVKDDDETISLFKEINKSQPVKEVDLPGQADERVIEAINEACAELKSSYEGIFSTSQRCRIPNINMDNLRQDLFDSQAAVNVVNTAESGKGGIELYQWIVAKNVVLIHRSEEEWEQVRSRKYAKTSKSAFAKALDKSKTTGLFIGLDNEWLFS